MVNGERVCRLLDSVKGFVDAGEIYAGWEALAPPYDVEAWTLPLPVWAQRGFADSGDKAWEILRTAVGAGPTHDKSINIYIHIPFCDQKCGFCDSYSFKLGGHQSEQISGYVRRLEAEIKDWGALPGLGFRGVSTVHLGGGTPLMLGIPGLTRIAAALRSNFMITADTEWALEATGLDLTKPVLAGLRDLGFTRLHVGVQTLTDPVREKIGRRLPAREILDRLALLGEDGWIVSVDMICGLPSQTITDWLTSLQQLVEVGINGFSLYELLIYPQNLTWAVSHGLLPQSHLPNYLMFQAGAAYLKGLRYRKNLFNHWADEQDKNIYFTFPVRGEDCLGIGAGADGVFGDYHYQHEKYAGYLKSDDCLSPGISGGVRRTAFENLMHPFETAVLSGWIPESMQPYLQVSSSSGVEGLAEQWGKLGLIELHPDGGYRLTGNGSWFAGNMIAEVHDRLLKTGIFA